MKYRIRNRTLDCDVGIYEGADREAALNAWAREMGYRDFIAACQHAAATLFDDFPERTEEEVRNRVWQCHDGLTIEEIGE